MTTSTTRIFARFVTARGDRMKQAQADADALIASYRLEQQAAFDASSAGNGE